MGYYRFLTDIPRYTSLSKPI